MPGQRKEIEKQLEKLPSSFTANDVNRMYEDLNKDVKFLKSKNIPMSQMEAELHKRHKTLAFSYPTLFFRVVRGEMDEHIFKSLMKLKRRVDEGEIDNTQAKKMVIDGARRYVEGCAPRVVRPKTEGGTVQEINLKRRVEDEEDGEC